MEHEQIVVEDRNGVRLITLNRPEKLNAWTRQMSRELTEAITEGNDDPAIGAFVVTGAGRGFCAGADIGGEFAPRADAAHEAERAGDHSDSVRVGDWVAMVRASKPMVAAINGAAVGVGLTMVLPMDHLVAGRSAKLSARFVKMGLVPELGSSHFLVQRCGFGHASDLALSGRMVLAPEAAEIGLVDRVVDDDALLDAAMETATGYGANPGPALRMIKELLTLNGADTDLDAIQRRELQRLNGADTDLDAIQRRELQRLNEAYATAEHREAIAAFMEKREPDFRQAE